MTVDVEEVKSNLKNNEPCLLELLLEVSNLRKQIIEHKSEIEKLRTIIQNMSIDEINPPTPSVD